MPRSHINKLFFGGALFAAYFISVNVAYNVFPDPPVVQEGLKRERQQYQEKWEALWKKEDGRRDGGTEEGS